VANNESKHQFRLSPLGCDSQVFTDPEAEEEITHIAEPINVPMPLGRRWMDAHLGDYYGAGLSLYLESKVGGTVTEVSQYLDEVDEYGKKKRKVVVADLRDVNKAGTEWAHQSDLEPGQVAVDPVLGRVYFQKAVGDDEEILGSFHYGFALPIGGGEYERGSTKGTGIRKVRAGEPLQPKLTAVVGGGTVEVCDSDRFEETPTIKVNAPPSDAKRRSVIVRAANGVKPLVAAEGPIMLGMGKNTKVVIDGLAVSGGAVAMNERKDSEPREIVLRDCTLVPGLELTPGGESMYGEAASLFVLESSAKVVIERSIIGPIVAVEGSEVVVRDSIVDATLPSRIAYCGRPEPDEEGLRRVGNAAQPKVGEGLAAGGALKIENSTVIGRVHATNIDASNVLFVSELPDKEKKWRAPVWIERRQVGCIRFSYVPPGSFTPRRFQCHPEGNAEAGTRPHFTSLQFGEPGYCQLRSATPDAILRGADDESEMGVMHQLFQPQREMNLRLRLDEYLRFGLEAGFFYAT
jgi:hypothetical protein